MRIYSKENRHPTRSDPARGFEVVKRAIAAEKSQGERQRQGKKRKEFCLCRPSQREFSTLENKEKEIKRNRQGVIHLKEFDSKNMVIGIASTEFESSRVARVADRIRYNKNLASSQLW